MIKLNDLAIGYNGEAILEHIDQEFDDGLIYGILAKSGAGISTISTGKLEVLESISKSHAKFRICLYSCSVKKITPQAVLPVR